MSKHDEQKDFIQAHETELAEKDKIPHYPTDGNDLRDFRESLIQRFIQTQIKLEHQIYLDKKKWSESNEIARWTFATPNRQMLFWMFAMNGIGEGFSVSDAADYLQRDRASVSKDLSELHALKYILRNTKEGYQRYYLPSQRLLNNAAWYSNYYVDLTLSLTEDKNRGAFFEYRSAERDYFKAQKKCTTIFVVAFC